jgi:prophage maintenance system killer protein
MSLCSRTTRHELSWRALPRWLTRLLISALEKAQAIRDPFEQSLFLLVHISYLQAFIDVNKRTARLASIISLIRGDYVPQSFVEVEQRAYLSAAIAVYELNEVGHVYQRSACDLFFDLNFPMT